MLCYYWIIVRLSDVIAGLYSFLGPRLARLCWLPRFDIIASFVKMRSLFTLRGFGPAVPVL